jgi:hypothetical protein
MLDVIWFVQVQQQVTSPIANIFLEHLVKGVLGCLNEVK